MSKVLLNYDPASGQLKTDEGMFVGSFFGLKEWEGFGGKPSVDDIVKLKEAGFTAEEIVMMVKKEVL